jgi:hypothetical protein
MKYVILFVGVLLPNIMISQVAITMPDEFSLTDFPEYDNWTYNGQTFFIIPVSMNEYIATESFECNISYDPQIVVPFTDFIQQINSPNNTVPNNVNPSLIGQQGTLSSQVFNVSTNLSLLSLSYQSPVAITEEQYNSNGEILIYLPFKKINGCYKSPFPISFWNGYNEGQYVNPNQTNAIIFNQSLSLENQNISIQNALVNFNILSADVVQNGNSMIPTIYGGTPPYAYQWTDKMDNILSADSIFTPSFSGDYLFYVYDANQCEHILYVTFDATAHILEHSELEVYPNPVRDFYIIDLQETAILKLFDTTGRLLRTATLNQTTAINREDLKSGIYFLNIEIGNKKRTHQLIFE